jgi:hypothetical protein
VYETKFHGMEFSTSGVTLGLRKFQILKYKAFSSDSSTTKKKFQILQHFRFQFFRLGMLNLSSYCMSRPMLGPEKTKISQTWSLPSNTSYSIEKAKSHKGNNAHEEFQNKAG